MSTKFPWNAILMEVAATLHSPQADLSLEWIPREQNIEADELSNGIQRRFSPENEMKIKTGELRFILLDELLDTGEELYGFIENAKGAKAPQAVLTKKGTKRKPDTRLRATPPW